MQRYKYIIHVITDLRVHYTRKKSHKQICEIKSLITLVSLYLYKL